MPDQTADSHKQQNAVWHILKQLPPNLVYYGSLCGAVFLAGGGELPKSLEMVAAGVGFGLFTNIVQRLVKGEAVPPQDIVQQIEAAIAQDEHIAHLLTERDFYNAIRQLTRRLDVSLTDLRERLIKNLDALPTREQVETVLTGQRDIAAMLEKILNIIAEIQRAAAPRRVITCNRVPKPDIFAGRGRELDALAKALDGERAVAITAVRGVGGIGKTTLAQEAADRAGDRFGLKLWAQLGKDYTDEIGPRWLRDWSGLDFPPDWKVEQMAAATKAALTEAARTACGEPILLVLDDVWPDTVKTARLLRTALPDGTTVLLTTRSEDVAAALDATSQTLQHLPPDDGAALMLEHLKDTRAADHRPQLEALSQALGGHPLALKLIARQLRRNFQPRRLAALVNELQTGLDAGADFAALKLDRGDDKVDSVSVTLRQTLDALGGGDPALNQRRGEQFRALGALPADLPVRVEYLWALWGAQDDDGLADLVAEGLLEAAARDDGESYQQHRLLRAYARALARQHGELDAAFDRYAEHIIGVAEQFDSLSPEAWVRLEADVPHVLAVGDTLYQQYTGLAVGTPPPTPQTTPPPGAALADRVLRFAYNITRFLSKRRAVRRIEWLEMGLAVSRSQGDQRGEAFFLNEIGLAWTALGEQHQARAYYEQALPLFRAVGDRGGEAATLNNIGDVWNDLGEHSKAWVSLKGALRLRRAENDRGGEAVTLNNIGRVWAGLGKYPKALASFQYALSLRRAVGDKGGEASTLSNIGAVYAALGENNTARNYYEQALSLFQAVGDRDKEAATLSNIAKTYLQDGDFEGARTILERIIAIPQKPANESAFRVNLASVLRRLNRLDDALEQVEQSIAILRHYDLPQDAAGQTLAQREALLQQLAQAKLSQVYETQGAEAVRALLRQAGLSDDVIEQLLARLAGSG